MQKKLILFLIIAAFTSAGCELFMTQSDDDSSTPTPQPTATPVPAPTPTPTPQYNLAAEAGDNQFAAVSTAVSFNASDSTGDNTIVSYEWDFGDGSTGTGVSVDHTFTSTGVYVVTLTVTDSEDNTDIDSCTITVNITGATLTAVAGIETADPIYEFDNVHFDGSDSTGDNTISSYAWDFGDGASATGVYPSPHPFETEGVHTVTLTVTDSEGNTASDTCDVTVLYLNKIRAIITASATEAEPGVEITFDASSSFSDFGDIETWEWFIDDSNYGTYKYGEIIAYSFSATDTFHVQLSVRDANYNWENVTISVEISDGTNGSVTVGVQ